MSLVINFTKLLILMSKIESCYEYCNQRYDVMEPQRLFCKKGCDSDEPMYEVGDIGKYVKLKHAINYALRKNKEIRNFSLVYLV